MTLRHRLARTTAVFAALMVAALLSGPAQAHCDSMDGPGVKDAQRALSSKTVTPVLKWVRAEDEEQIRKDFALALAVRGESEAAKAVADRYFFETLIRIHRASEGEGFTGLKSSGSGDPAMAAADKALEDGNINKLAEELASSVRQAVKQRFAEAREKRQTAEKSVAQGREYVAVYVQLTHFAETTHGLTSHGASHKHAENR